MIASTRSVLTTRAGRWATTAVGRDGRAVSDVAAELGCDWHTVNKAVLVWGEALLAADTERVGSVEALGLDETLFGRESCWRTRRWRTSIMDVCGGQLLDIVAGRDAQGVTSWLLNQPQAWRDNIVWGALDLSEAYRRSFDVALQHVGQVADPFHVIRMGNNAVDEVRRRVQNDTLGYRGRKGDPLYRTRRLLISAHERLSEHADGKLRGLLTTGDPRGEVRLAWHAKKPCAASMTSTAHNSPAPTWLELADNLTDPDCPPELSKLGRTLRRWHTQIINWHHPRVTRCLRFPTIHQLPDPSTPLRRETKLGTPQHHHSPLMREEPDIRCRSSLNISVDGSEDAARSPGIGIVNAKFEPLVSSQLV